MERIRREAERCWIEDEEDSGESNLDESKFTNLVRESYKYITDPEDSIYYSEDGDAVAFTNGILPSWRPVCF